MFWAEEDREPLPATEGDVLAYLWYMFLERRVEPASVRQYVSAVSRFHELQGLESPTRTPLVSAVMQAYISKTESDRPVQLTRVGLSATTMGQVVAYGLDSEVLEDVGCCSMVVFAFVFQCRSIAAAQVSVGDITVTPAFSTVTLTHRKERSRRRPLRLTYPCGTA